MLKEKRIGTKYVQSCENPKDRRFSKVMKLGTHRM